MKKIFAPQAMLADGWSRDVLIEIDDSGSIATARSRESLEGAQAAGGDSCRASAGRAKELYVEALRQRQ